MSNAVKQLIHINLIEGMKGLFKVYSSSQAVYCEQCGQENRFQKPLNMQYGPFIALEKGIKGHQMLRDAIINNKIHNL